MRWVVLGSLLTVAGAAADWRQFRGPEFNGSSAETEVPGASGLDGCLAWVEDLPGRGLSSPVVVGERVFVSCASGPRQDRLHVICFDAGTGNRLWERRFWATGRTMCQEKTCVAAPTPTSDGRRVCVLFSSNDLICLDLEGNLIWLRALTLDYPNASNSIGLASSPTVAGETLIVQVETDAESFAAGLDLKTGRNRWKIDRPKAANWTSPVVWRDEAGRDFAGLQSSRGLTAVEAATGEVVWDFPGGAATIPSTALAGGTLLVPSHGLAALKASGARGEAERVWQSSRLRPGTPSPVVFRERVYVVNTAGVLTCGDLRDGSRLWQLRLDGPFSATPVGAASLLYLVNEKGLLQVVDVSGEEGRVVSRIDLGEPILGTPALAGHALYLRCDKKLWKFAEP